MELPLSHSLPKNLATFSSFDRLPERLSEYVHETSGRFICIDVGANIGGTVAFFWKEATDVFIAIEPHPKFRAYLTKNWGWNQNVTILPDVCSSVSRQGTFLIQEGQGTASISESERGTILSQRTLDELVEENPHGAAANVVKIDTDGHDFEVIAGSEGLLARNQPALLFECDAFGNNRYVEECLVTLERLSAHGYESFLLYDNFGNLMGKYSLAELVPFRNLLFYQLTSDFHYFDILTMREEELRRFYERELEHFISTVADEQLHHTASVAADLIDRTAAPQPDCRSADGSRSSIARATGYEESGPSSGKGGTQERE